MKERGNNVNKFLHALHKRMTQGELTAQIEWAIIHKVNDDDTCDVQMLTDDEGVITEQIRTQFSSNMTMKPVVGSKCLVAHIMDEDMEGLLVWCEQVEAITINGDEHGGLCITPKLVEEMNKMKAWMQKVNQKFAQWVPVANDGGAALKSLSNQFTSMSVPDFSAIENEKVKHGSGA